MVSICRHGWEFLPLRSQYPSLLVVLRTARWKGVGLVVW